VISSESEDFALWCEIKASFKEGTRRERKKESKLEVLVKNPQKEALSPSGVSQVAGI